MAGAVAGSRTVDDRLCLQGIDWTSACVDVSHLICNGDGNGIPPAGPRRPRERSRSLLGNKGYAAVTSSWSWPAVGYCLPSTAVTGPTSLNSTNSITPSNGPSPRFTGSSPVTSAGVVLRCWWVGRASRMVLGSRDSGYGCGVVAVDGSIHLAARSFTTTRPLIRSCGPFGCIAE